MQSTSYLTWRFCTDQVGLFTGARSRSQIASWEGSLCTIKHFGGRWMWCSSYHQDTCASKTVGWSTVAGPVALNRSCFWLILFLADTWRSRVFDTYDRRSEHRPIHFYIFENAMELHARQMLLLVCMHCLPLPCIELTLKTLAVLLLLPPPFPPPKK